MIRRWSISAVAIGGRPRHSTGYSFNLDAQILYDAGDAVSRSGTNTNLTIWQELGILGIAMIT